MCRFYSILICNFVRDVNFPEFYFWIPEFSNLETHRVLET